MDIFVKNTRPRLVELLNNSFSVFKQYYTYFHSLFHSHIFQKNTNNVTQMSLRILENECIFCLEGVGFLMRICREDLMNI